MKTESNADRDSRLSQEKASARKGSLGLWMIVVAAFAVMVTAYFFVIRASHAAQIQEVPLTTKGGRP